MTKDSDSQQIFSEIEVFLNAGKFEDAKVLLNFIDYDALDRKNRLHLLLINATLDGPGVYKAEIDQLSLLLNPSESEKEIVGKILLLASRSGEKCRNYPSQPHPLTRPLDQALPNSTLANQSAENTELQRDRERELLALDQQLAELAASKEHAVCSLQDTVERNKELLQAKEAALIALENQLRDKAALVESREADLQASQYQINQLDAQLADLVRARSQEVSLLGQELARRSELLLIKDDAMKSLEQRCTEQISEREQSERLLVEELREKAALFQATVAASEELEKRSRANIEALERQLADKQKVLEDRGAELAELRRQNLVLTESLAEAGQRRHHAERQQASRAFAVTEFADGDSAKAATDDALTNDRQNNSDWLDRLHRAWQVNWAPKAVPAGPLAVAAIVLVILPSAYLLSSDQGRTAAKPNPNAGWVRTSEPEIEASGSAALPAKNLRPAQTIDVENRIAKQREARADRAVAYVTRRVVPLREGPRYAASPMTQIGAGTQIIVLETQGNWWRVRTQPTGEVGYLRKEYLVPQTSTQY
ncbi:MAG TPA: SH3 domain-containing protein [Candidatus Binatus sp.]|nr:SH3 domain-containing protein [Candidatus Binatus sp.]